MISFLPIIAEMLYPFPRAFPNQAMSGSTSYNLCKPPKVCLKPEVHSSKIKTNIFFYYKSL